MALETDRTDGDDRKTQRDPATELGSLSQQNSVGHRCIELLGGPLVTGRKLTKEDGADQTLKS